MRAGIRQTEKLFAVMNCRPPTRERDRPVKAITSVDELIKLDAESVVLKHEEFGIMKNCSYQKYPNGEWFCHGFQRRGMTSRELFESRRGDDGTPARIVLLHEGDVPVTGGLTEFEAVVVTAERRRWRLTNQNSEGIKLDRDGVYINFRYSPTTGKLTKLKRIERDGYRTEITRDKLGTILRWLHGIGE